MFVASANNLIDCRRRVADEAADEVVLHLTQRMCSFFLSVSWGSARTHRGNGQQVLTEARDDFVGALGSHSKMIFGPLPSYVGW